MREQPLSVRPHQADQPDAPSTDSDLELPVPYALFENDEQMTRPFRTEREVWEAAERADLVTLDTHGEKVLDNNFEIKPCEATADELAGAPGQEIVFPDARSADRTLDNGAEQRPSPAGKKTAAETSS
ncbi:hypothetical protein BBta_4319 [Bradyrhizobium sp. BTAi1]|jgi:hypothetical protein|nr:hypothetical protein BBta_4319 [Bradyrhizobium sp. BTAi1]